MHFLLAREFPTKLTIAIFILGMMTTIMAQTPKHSTSLEHKPKLDSRHGDSLALIALYHALDGKQWIQSKNWLSNKPIDEWHGVFVYRQRVKNLVLNNNQLKGSVPPEIGNFRALQRLSLNANQIQGISPQIGQLSNLEALSLYGNQLKDIPTSLGK